MSKFLDIVKEAVEFDENNVKYGARVNPFEDNIVINKDGLKRFMALDVKFDECNKKYGVKTK